jgi:hypothetical protein
LGCIFLSNPKIFLLSRWFSLSTSFVMGIQKAVFKFIIRWATNHSNGAALQHHLAAALGAIQDLKVAYCPCRPYKDDNFGGFIAEVDRAMTTEQAVLAERPRVNETKAVDHDGVLEADMLVA